MNYKGHWEPIPNYLLQFETDYRDFLDLGDRISSDMSEAVRSPLLFHTWQELCCLHVRWMAVRLKLFDDYEQPSSIEESGVSSGGENTLQERLLDAQGAIDEIKWKGMCAGRTHSYYTCFLLYFQSRHSEQLAVHHSFDD